ncbi:hypothetical protein PsorP6_001643 [Peronosclerospora sorghi]|uniref:Uncharacterized protein n=1 Tax=Peronosclerospora sorghi TaxID=230839 RepID=A0ACC0WUG9_9STRA|nr:hypothetical protein PsorP6_001643 [Peronosclerospora sorghi]
MLKRAMLFDPSLPHGLVRGDEATSTRAGPFPGLDTLRHTARLSATVHDRDLLAIGNAPVPVAAGAPALPCLDPDAPRAVVRRLEIGASGLFGPAEGVAQVATIYDRRHSEDPTEVHFVNKVGYGAADKSLMDPSRVHCSVRNLLTGMDDADVRVLVHEIATLEDRGKTYLPLYFRLIALGEALASNERVTNTLKLTQASVWPTTGPEWKAGMNRVAGLLSGALPGVMLDASSAPLGLTANALACIMLACCPYVGTSVGPGDRQLGLSAYCGDRYEVVLYGAIRRRPLVPAQLPQGAYSIAAVCEALNFILSCTGDGHGLEAAFRFAAARMRHAGPEVQHLAVGMEARLHDIHVDIRRRLELFWPLCRSYQGEGGGGWHAQVVPAMQAIVAGADAGWLAPAPQGGVAFEACLTAMGEDYCIMARASASMVAFVEGLTTAELILLLANLRDFNPWPVCHHGVHAAQIPRGGGAVAHRTTWMHTRSEAALPSDGMDGSFVLAGSSGLAHLKMRMASMGAMVQRVTNPVPRLTAQTFWRGLGLLGMIQRASADVAVHAARVSRLTRQLATGGGVAGLDARLEAILSRKLERGLFDAAETQQLIQDTICKHSNLQWWELEGIEPMGAMTPDYSERDAVTLCAALHPTARESLIGCVPGPGGSLTPHVHEVANRPSGYLWDGAMEETLTREHAMGAVDVFAWHRGLRPRYSLIVTEDNPDMRRVYPTTLDWPILGKVRPSDAMPHGVSSGVSTTWWSGIPIEGSWGIT